MYECKKFRGFLLIITLFAALSLPLKTHAAVTVPDVNPSDAAMMATAKDGMALFKANCAACHAVDRKMVGPALAGVWDRWDSENKLLAWIKNSQDFLATGDAYANKLYNEYNKSVMQAFPTLTDDQIRNILVYVKAKQNGIDPAAPAGAAPAAGAATAQPQETKPWLLYSLMGFLAVLALLLWNVTSKLDSVVREQSGEAVPATAKKPFSKKLLTALIIVGSVALVINIATGAIDLGRSQGYEPDQPIKFSHALHVGQNKIDCQYCHSSVEKSRHAGIPGTQVCMNCHKYVQQGPKYGTEEINKIYAFAGWDADKQAFVRAPKNIEWVKIHNLPDHVYFNHSQHVVAGKIACQTCQ
jgi:mono/diheme cytochrome c family protein